MKLIIVFFAMLTMPLFLFVPQLSLAQGMMGSGGCEMMGMGWLGGILGSLVTLALVAALASIAWYFYQKSKFLGRTTS